MKKEKKYTREEILKAVGDSLKELNELINKNHEDHRKELKEDEDILIDHLDEMKDQLLIISLAEAIKSRLKENN